MKICFTINCQRTKEQLEEFKQLVLNNEFRGIEIFYPYNVTDTQKKLYDSYINEINKNNIEVVLHLPHGPKADFINEKGKINKNTTKLMIDAINYAYNMKATKLTLHLGKTVKNRVKEINLVIKVLNRLLKLASKYDMLLMIENMPGASELGYSPDEILYVINSVKFSNMRFILDTGHANVSEYSIDEYLNKLGSYLEHIHFSNNYGLKDEHAGFENGNIDFDNLFEKLNIMKYNKLHCLEIIFKETTELLKNKDDILKYQQYYKKEV